MVLSSQSQPVEELINRVNSLTLDKNRLRQKLTQMSPRESSVIMSQSSGTISSNATSKLQHQNSTDSFDASLAKSGTNLSNNRSPGDSSSNNGISSNVAGTISNKMIVGVECSTSCEEDLIYMNDLYRKRVDEYNESWEYIQSKCTALLAELNALQENYIILKREKLDLEEKYQTKCDECDKTNSELQTVVLNYETQLSAMSEHLSMITNQVNLADN